MSQIDWLKTIVSLSDELQTEIKTHFFKDDGVRDLRRILEWYFGVFSVLSVLPTFAAEQVRKQPYKQREILANGFAVCLRAGNREADDFARLLEHLGIPVIPFKELDAEMREILTVSPESWMLISGMFEKAIASLSPAVAKSLMERTGEPRPEWLKPHMDWEAEYVPRFRKILGIMRDVFEPREGRMHQALQRAFKAFLATLNNNTA